MVTTRVWNSYMIWKCCDKPARHNTKQLYDSNLPPSPLSENSCLCILYRLLILKLKGHCKKERSVALVLTGRSTTIATRQSQDNQRDKRLVYASIKYEQKELHFWHVQQTAIIPLKMFILTKCTPYHKLLVDFKYLYYISTYTHWFLADFSCKKVWFYSCLFCTKTWIIKNALF